MIEVETVACDDIEEVVGSEGTVKPVYQVIVEESSTGTTDTTRR